MLDLDAIRKRVRLSAEYDEHAHMEPSQAAKDRAVLLAEVERLRAGPDCYCAVCGSCGVDECCNPTCVGGKHCMYPDRLSVRETAASEGARHALQSIACYARCHASAVGSVRSVNEWEEIIRASLTAAPAPEKDEICDTMAPDGQGRCGLHVTHVGPCSFSPWPAPVDVPYAWVVEWPDGERSLVTEARAKQLSASVRAFPLYARAAPVAQQMDPADQNAALADAIEAGYRPGASEPGAQRIEGWARRQPTMEEQWAFRSAASFHGRDPSSRGFSDPATLLIHPAAEKEKES